MTLRFCKNKFDEKQESTVDASYQEQTVSLPDNKKAKLTIWDTAGQEKYHALNAVYYRGASGALIVYDVTDKDSFEKVKTWFVELKKYLEQNTPIIIAGNKCDIVNKTVSEEEAASYARSVGVEHINTSAKSGQNVNEIF